MRVWLRAFLVWVMVVALPVQGAAVSLMQACGPSHARMSTGLDPRGPEAGPAHAHLAVSPHPAAMANALEPPATLMHDEGPGMSATAGSSSCSACAACCSALALPIDAVLPGHPEPVHLRSWSPPPLVQSHLPDALDRPPRAVLG